MGDNNNEYKLLTQDTYRPEFAAKTLSVILKMKDKLKDYVQIHLIITLILKLELGYITRRKMVVRCFDAVIKHRYTV